MADPQLAPAPPAAPAPGAPATPAPVAVPASGLAPANPAPAAPAPILSAPRRRRLPNRRVALALAVLGAAALALLVAAGLALAPEASRVDFAAKALAPSGAHPFGTDWLGRDMLLRTVSGLAVSVAVGRAAPVLVNVSCGTPPAIRSPGKKVNVTGELFHPFALAAGRRAKWNEVPAPEPGFAGSMVSGAGVMGRAFTSVFVSDAEPLNISSVITCPTTTAAPFAWLIVP